MAYGMNQLRKAGRYILDADAAYAKAVENSISNTDSVLGGLRGMTSAAPLRDTLTLHGAETGREYAQAAALNTGIAAANIASRYMLPAGGVTMAGKGLYDLTVAFGGMADQPEPNQLSL